MSDPGLCAQCRAIPLDLFLGTQKTYQLYSTCEEMWQSSLHCRACYNWGQYSNLIVLAAESSHAIDPYCGGHKTHVLPAIWSKFGELKTKLRRKYMVRRRRKYDALPVILSSFGEPKIKLGRENNALYQKLVCSVETINQYTRVWGGAGYYKLNSLSQNSIDLMRALIDNCANTHIHPLCKGFEGFLDVPSRLLFVGDADMGPQLRVVLTSNLSQVPAYVALSHCWGRVAEDAPWKLRKSNMAEYQCEVPMGALPQTFIDAVEVTRGLKESYLWIDSLCILQDCKMDWETESEKMASVYTNAICTLGSASDSAHGGCVGVRSRCAQFSLQLAAGTVAFYWNNVVESEDRAPIKNRAWCLQERELAKRFVQFCDQGFLWSCAEQCVSEYNFFGSASSSEADLPILMRHKSNSQLCPLEIPLYPVEVESSLVAEGAHHERAVTLQKRSVKQHSLLYAYWYDLVTEYTMRQITKSSDRLPAIAGLALRMAKALPDDLYTIGFWVSDMNNGLLWTGVFLGREPPHTAIAPSWSWVSLNSRVRYNKHWFDKPGLYGELKAPEFFVISALDRDTSPFPLLRVLGSLIIVKCVINSGLKPGSINFYVLQICDERLKHIERPVVRSAHEINLFSNVGSIMERIGKSPGLHQVQKLHDPIFLPSWDWAGEHLGEDFHCLIFATDDHGGYRKPRGLILKCIDSEAQLYKRVGWFETKDNHEYWSNMEAWDKLCNLEREEFYIK